MKQNRFISAPERSLSGNLYLQLQKDILTGSLEAGMKLTEQALCDRYRVSRTPVREALRQLEAEGLVENFPNRGAFVVGFTDQDIRDMYQLRKIYEMQAVRWAIERISDEELEQLGETFEFMEFYTQKGDLEKMLNINLGFHQQIYRAAGSRILRQVLSSYQLYIRYRRSGAVLEDGYLETVLEEHRAIYRAFLEKDPEAGAAAMEAHIDHSYLRQSGL